VGEQPHLSIGEVLNLLKEEFPDVTISKIRFLESQGLLDPERTPSGYRKFYDDDIERLRWILRQQRENFLPLKVIKGRLEGHREEGTTSAAATEEPAPAPDPPAPPEERPTASSGRANPLDIGPTSASLTLDELASASGLNPSQLGDLERFGLLTGRAAPGGVYYDEEALLVARLAAAFMRHGVEGRHLRMYRTSAEREAGFFEQLILPMMKQRNPTARRQAVETLAELARLGGDLRAAMLRQALRGYSDNL
jgi:DNA-binding transcriptional MerR regulator